jgi:hypothetical protein
VVDSEVDEMVAAEDLGVEEMVAAEGLGVEEVLEEGVEEVQ